jgi:hypothetical protein
MKLGSGFLNFVFSLFAALLVAGCATPGVNVSGGNVTVDMAPKPGEGHVVLKVVSARPVSVLNAKWKSVTLESKRTQRTFELYDFADPGAAGSMFFGRIEEGEYEIVKLESIGPGPGLILALLTSDFQDLRARIGSFTVRSGSLTNLGLIAIAPPPESGKHAKIEYLGGAIGRKSVTEDLERRTRQQVALPEIPGHQIAAADEEKALARARALVSVLSWGDDAQRSDLFGGAALGQIVTRSASGDWQTMPLDTLDDVRYARRLPDGTLVAGLSQGRYAVRKPGQAWKYLDLDGASGALIHIDTAAGASGALFVVAGARDTAVMYRSSLDADKAETRVLATFDFSYVMMWGPAVSLEDRLIVPKNVPGISRVVELNIVDKKTLQMRTEKHSFWVRDWQKLPSGPLVIARQNGMTSFVSVSPDNGATWAHSETPGPSSIYFLDARKGYGFDMSTGAISVTGRLMKTADGGKTWTTVGAPLTRPTGGRILHASPSGEVIVSSGYEIYSTRDDGATWSRLLPREAN